MVKATAKRARRRRKVWLYYVLEGYTQAEVAEKLGVSLRTVARDLAYLKEHPEEIPSVDEEAFTAYVQNMIVRILEEGELSDWQKIKILRDLARSQVTKKIKKEEAISVTWGGLDETDHTEEQTNA
jgi:transposase